MDAKQIEVELEELETRIERLRALYEQYFMGIERMEPQVPRKDVDRRIWVLRREQIRNTGMRFKFQMLIQRYNTYQQYWQRVAREMENGTYRRDVIRAAARFGERATQTIVGKKRAEVYARLAEAQKARRGNKQGSDASASEDAPASQTPGSQEPASVESGASASEIPVSISVPPDAPDSQPIASGGMAAQQAPAVAGLPGVPRPGSAERSPPLLRRPLPEARGADAEASKLRVAALARQIKDSSGEAAARAGGHVGGPLDLDLDEGGATPAAVPAGRASQGPVQAPPRVPPPPPRLGGQRPAAVPGPGQLGPGQAQPGQLVPGQAQPPRVSPVAFPPNRGLPGAPPSSGVLAPPVPRPPAPRPPGLAKAGLTAGLPAASAEGPPSAPQPASGIPSVPRPVRAPTEPRSTGAPRVPMPPRPAGAMRAPTEPRPAGAMPTEPRPAGAMPTEPRPAGATRAPTEPRPAGAMRAPTEPRPAGAMRAPTEPRAPGAPPSPEAPGAGTRVPAPTANRPPPRPVPPPPKSDDPDLSDQRLRQIYAKYVETKRAANESTAGVTFEKLSQTLRAQANKLRAAHPAKKVDYEVVTKEGKTLLKPVIR